MEEESQTPVQSRIGKPVSVDNNIIEVKESDSGNTFSEVVDPDEELEDLQYLNKRLKEEIKRINEENIFLRKQIDQLEIDVKNLDKANVHLVGQKESLIESKHKLEELQVQKEEVFAMAIHDIKNPAAAIKSCIDLLTSYDLNAMEQQELMTAIITSSEDIVNLSQKMCTMIVTAKPEVTLKFESGSIKKVIDDVCIHNLSYAKAKKVKLVNKASTGLPEIKIDSEKIEEVIDNLVNNAIKFAPPDTIVEVKTYMKSKVIGVEVSDNGVGMSEEDMKKAFNKGATLSAVPTGLEQQSGIGLWIVKRIIEQHNGNVWINSKLGSGTSFIFELPL